MTHTYALMYVSKSTYCEIHSILDGAGYLPMRICDDQALDLSGIAIQEDPEEKESQDEQIIAGLEAALQVLINSSGPTAAVLQAIERLRRYAKVVMDLEKRYRIEVPITLEEIRKRDADAGELWFTGPESFTAMAARDRRTLLTLLKVDQPKGESEK